MSPFAAQDAPLGEQASCASARFYARRRGPATVMRLASGPPGVDLYCPPRLSHGLRGSCPACRLSTSNRRGRTANGIEWFTIRYRTLAIGGFALLGLGLAGLGYTLLRRPAAPSPTPVSLIDTGAQFNTIDGSVQVKRAGTLDWVSGREDDGAEAERPGAHGLGRRGRDPLRRRHCLHGAARQPDHNRGELPEPRVAPAAGVAVDPVRRSELPDGLRGRQRADHDLHTHRADDRAGRHGGQHPGCRERRERPARLQRRRRGTDEQRPEGRPRLERGAEDQRRGRCRRQDGAAVGAAADGPAAPDRGRPSRICSRESRC